MNVIQKPISLFIGLILIASPVYSESMFVEVYTDDNISIESGIVDLESKILHFGDVLSLVVNITYKNNMIPIAEITPALFTDAWPEGQGAYLLEHNSVITSGSTPVSSNEFRFQILACPDEEVLCRGTRQYLIPEFSFSFQILDESGTEVSVETVQFRPWPPTVMIGSAIPLGEEGELNTFPTYFPTGAFPDPLSGKDDDTSSSLIAGSLFLLLGGILMSPFSFFKSGSSVQKTKTRWEEIQEQLHAGAFEDDAHLLDAIRKCLVWYCVDELDIDPFYWVKHQEEVSSKQQKGTEEFEEYRKLFIDVLHNPEGQGKALLDRLSPLLVKNG